MRLAVEAAVAVLLAVVPVGAFYYFIHRPPPVTSPSSVGTPLPSLALPSLFEGGKSLQPSDFKGQVWLLNLWASSCTACRLEHDLLVELSEEKVVTIVGLNESDDPAAARAWLRKLGNPFFMTVTDGAGRVSAQLRVSGFPATFVIDGSGVVRYIHRGPLTVEVLRDKVIPLVRQLRIDEAKERSSSVN